MAGVQERQVGDDEDAHIEYDQHRLIQRDGNIRHIVNCRVEAHILLQRHADADADADDADAFQHVLWSYPFSP